MFRLVSLRSGKCSRPRIPGEPLSPRLLQTDVRVCREAGARSYTLLDAEIRLL